MTTSRMTRRAALKALGAAGLGAPAVFRLHAAAPSETLRHASFGASGMAWSDIGSLTASKHLKLVAVAEVDLRRTADVTKRFPDAGSTRTGASGSTRKRTSTRSTCPPRTTCTARSPCGPCSRGCTSIRRNR